MAGLKARDSLALNQLYKMYAGALLGIISRIVQHEEIAEDLLQETFIKIWNSVVNYDSSKGRLFTWMMNVARNLAIDTIRSKEFRNSRKRQEIEGNLNLIDSQKNSFFNADTIGVKELLSNLPADQFLIIDLTFFKGFTHVEAAEYLNWPLGTVKTRIKYAVKRLRKFYDYHEI